MAKLTKLEFDPFGRHNELGPDDECYYLGDYTAGAGYAYSAENQFMLNLKKPMDRHGSSEWSHKTNAIVRMARILDNTFSSSDLSRSYFFPMPPSKAKGDPMYDDRLVKILQKMTSLPPENICEALVMKTSMIPVHLNQEQRKTTEELEGLLGIEATLLPNDPKAIWIFDDVITTGAHFKAAKNLLKRIPNFYDVPIRGLFVMRSVRGPQERDLEL